MEMMVNKQRLRAVLERSEPSLRQDPCLLCAGPPNHGGRCIDDEGYILPAYAALAEEWEAAGWPLLSGEEISDLEQMLEEAEDEHRAE